MKAFVVDASIAAKWYLPEAHGAAAQRLLDPSRRLLAPDLLFPEVGNVLWKRVLKGEVGERKAVEILSALEAVPLQIWESRSLMPVALEIGCRSRSTIYDSLYVALAMVARCPLVTADRGLYDTHSEGRQGPQVLWVEDIPRAS